MPSYVWIADDEDGSHGWFEADDDEHASERARRLCLPVFDTAHVREMEFSIWEAREDGDFVGVVEFTL